MTLQQVTLLLLCTCFAASIAAEPARVREARQVLSGKQAATSVSTSTSTKTTMSSNLPTSSSSSSSSTPTPTPSSPILNFTVQNMTTCTSGLISWDYNGTAAGLLLSITNIGVPQDGVGTLFHITARQSIINTTIQQQLTNTSALSYTWPSVNLTQGWYEIRGLVLSTPALSNDSEPFFITNGSDVSCLSAFLSSSTSSTPTSNTRLASVVGGLVGGIFTVVLAVVAGMCLWRRKKTSAKGDVGQKWGSLKSNSPNVPPGNNGTRAPNNHFHAHSESTGPMLHNVAGVKVSTTSIDTPDGSDEDVEVVSDEKLVSPASSSGMSAFDALNTPARYDRRTSAYSIQTPTTIASEASRSRVHSALTSPQTLEQQAQRIRSSMETSAQRRSERLSMPSLPPPAIISRLPPSPTCIRPQEEYPLTPVNRSVSTGAVSIARRTSRKPVPQYDSSTLLEDKSAATTDSVSTGAESSQSDGVTWGAGANGTPSDLIRKSSLGDKRPVHYLIPDMPPPQRDDD